MPFSYYDRLSERNKAIYRRSDDVAALKLPAPDELRPIGAAWRGLPGGFCWV
jgi:hypothetical protein